MPRTSIKFVGFLVAILAAFGLAHALIAGEQAEIILTHVPAKSSVEYKALQESGKPIGGQDLAMTNAEMWTVPAENYAALLKTAAAQGVAVRRLDDSASPEMATAMSAEQMQNMKMTPAQQEMMHNTMQSKATVGASMMMLPDAATMEYTLTKRMAAPEGSPPQTLQIPLNDKLTVTATRTGVSKTEDGYVWRGFIDGSGEPVTLLWWPSGRVAGTVVHGGHTYVVKNIDGNMHAMLEYSPEKLPPDHGAAGKTMMEKMGMHADPLVQQGDAGMMLSPDKRPKEAAAEPSSGPPKDVTINLIIAYTKKAASHYNDIVKDLIDVAIAQANQAFIDSGAPNVHVKVVHAYETDYVENGTHFDHVYRFRNKGDGYMDEIHDLRKKYQADVAALIVDDPMGCGLSIRVAAEAPDAFTAVHHECMATMYSLAHEIGHLIGARHDRALDDTAMPYPYGHGFVHGKEWRTMMSYMESCDNCPRRPIWSSPDVKVDGVPAGDADTNNAKVIREGAARVAKFHEQLDGPPKH